MNVPKARNIVPAMIMAGSAAVPVLTIAEIFAHTSSGASPLAGVQGAPIAAAPQRPASTGKPASSGTPSGAGTYTGSAVSQPYGTVQAALTVQGGKITDVTITAPQDNPRSAFINQQAVPILRQETLQAQSARINLVSGATLTSEAYTQSLQSALDRAGSQGNAPKANSSSTSAQGSALQAPSIAGGGDD